MKRIFPPQKQFLKKVKKTFDKLFDGCYIETVKSQTNLRPRKHKRKKVKKSVDKSKEV